MLIDTHTHLYLPEFDIDGGGEAAVRRALDAGVEHMIFPNVDLTSIEPMRLLHAKFPESTSMAMGLHPTEVGESWRDDLAQVEEELRSHRHDYVAVGEIGIDLYWDKTFAEQQMQVLERQMQWAQEMNLPVIIHCREGLDQTLEVLQGFGSSRGVMHSFGGTPEDVERIRSVVDYHFGINGIVTFKNSKLRDSLPAITLDRLLLETDSPYLAPVPH
ncbi:MAG: TatD family hydrolase, partial [Paramuribaculum sp.]|nr:TatD family hydrolase [Paramuribaculum sp.]